MSELPTETFAVIQKLDGYSGRSEGPAISDASEYLTDGMMPMPKPAKGQVLIKMRMASVNPSDLHFIKGEYGQPRVQGAAAGFEGCGDVVAAGEGAEGLVGQRVAFVTTGAWSEYCVTLAAMCIPLHPAVKDEDGAAQIVNPLTAVGMVDIAKKRRLFCDFGSGEPAWKTDVGVGERQRIENDLSGASDGCRGRAEGAGRDSCVGRDGR